MEIARLRYAFSVFFSISPNCLLLTTLRANPALISPASSVASTSAARFPCFMP